MLNLLNLTFGERNKMYKVEVMELPPAEVVEMIQSCALKLRLQMSFTESGPIIGRRNVSNFKVKTKSLKDIKDFIAVNSEKSKVKWKLISETEKVCTYSTSKNQICNIYWV